MKQLVQNLRNGDLKLEEVPYPCCKAGGVVVRTFRSLISAGTERSIIESGEEEPAGQGQSPPRSSETSFGESSQGRAKEGV